MVAKVAHLLQATCAQLKRLLKSPTSLHCEWDPGTVVHIPAGFMFMTLATEDSDLIRWGCLQQDPAHIVKATNITQEPTRAYPEVAKKKTFAEWLAWLQDHSKGHS